MNHYFVVAYFQTGLAPYTYVGTDINRAMSVWDEDNAECPCDFLRFNEESKMIESYEPVTNGTKIIDWKWVPFGRAWFVVRHNPGFSYPETVICQDGIFETLAETEAYIKEHGGSWKMYCFSELQHKMAESITLEEKLREERMKTGTDLADLPF